MPPRTGKRWGLGAQATAARGRWQKGTMATEKQIAFFNKLIDGFAPSRWMSADEFAQNILAGLTAGEGVNQGRHIFANLSDSNIDPTKRMLAHCVEQLTGLDWSQIDNNLASLMIDGAKRSPAAALVEHLQIKHDAERVVEFLNMFFVDVPFFVEMVQPSGFARANMYHDKRGKPIAIISQTAAGED